MSKLREMLEEKKRNEQTKNGGVSVSPPPTNGGNAAAVHNETPKVDPPRQDQQAREDRPKPPPTSTGIGARFAAKIAANEEKKKVEGTSAPIPLADVPKYVAPIVAETPTQAPPQSHTEIAGYDEFRKNLDYLASHIEEKDLVKQVLQTILVQLQRNPHFKDILAGDGVLKPSMNLIVRALRRAYTIAARAKQEKRGKKAAKDAEFDAIAREFADAGITFE